jgi:hypothetical protein
VERISQDSQSCIDLQNKEKEKTEPVKNAHYVIVENA